VIQSFADAITADIYNGVSSTAARSIDKALWRVIRRKLDMVNAAAAIKDLREPPGNRLEALKGRQAGRFSIRVNDQYRVTFRFEDGNAFDVRCEDYH
jgi:proteic killer suppression protein